ncbi:MAG: phosphatase PAP2 family protein [Bryobacterales bacterium]|nr:phosphatase PAP2 family protein [Bryobacterales bacterium]
MDSARVVLRYIESRDHTVMRRVNTWRPPRWVRVWMLCATRGGDGWLWYAMALILLLAGGQERFTAVGASVLASAFSIFLFLRLKKLAGRRRPCMFQPHCWTSLLPPDQFSFPSGHSMTAFAFVVPLIQYYPSLAAGLLFCAASVAVSRILLGMHFLSDVLAGSILGAALGYAAFTLI